MYHSLCLPESAMQCLDVKGGRELVLPDQLLEVSNLLANYRLVDILYDSQILE